MRLKGAGRIDCKMFVAGRKQGYQKDSECRRALVEKTGLLNQMQLFSDRYFDLVSSVSLEAVRKKH